MLAVLMSELAAWQKNGSRLSLLLALGTAGVVLIASGGQVLAFLIAVLAFQLWLAWTCGFERWSLTPAWHWSLRNGVGGRSVIIGKTAAWFLLALGHLAVLAPLVFLALAAWGMPFMVFLAACGIILGGGLFLFAFIMLPFGSDTSLSGWVGGVLAIGWWLSGLLVAPIGLSNPFTLLWGLVERRPAAVLVAGSGMTFGLALAGLFAGGLLLGRLARGHRE